MGMGSIVGHDICLNFFGIFLAGIEGIVALVLIFCVKVHSMEYLRSFVIVQQLTVASLIAVLLCFSCWLIAPLLEYQTAGQFRNDRTTQAQAQDHVMGMHQRLLQYREKYDSLIPPDSGSGAEGCDGGGDGEASARYAEEGHSCVQPLRRPTSVEERNCRSETVGKFAPEGSEGQFLIDRGHGRLPNMTTVTMQLLSEDE